METFGILCSCPIAFLMTLVYATLVRRATESQPQIRVWFRRGSIVVLSVLAMELVLLTTLGVATSRRLLDPGFLIVHLLVFFFAPPSLANLLVLQKRFPILADPFLASVLCTILAFFLTIVQYDVTDM